MSSTREKHEKEDVYGAERGVTPPEPEVAAEDAQVRAMHALAAVGLVFGTAAAASLPFGLLRLHQGDIFGDARAFIYDDPIRGTSFQALWMIFSSLFGAGLGAALLAGSVGALRFRPWARTVLTIWAVSSLVFGAVGVFFFGSWLLPPWRSQWAEVRGVVDSLVNLGGWAVGSTLALAMLCMLTRPRVKAAFQHGGQRVGTSG